MAVASKQSGLFQPSNLVAKLGEVAAFGTYLVCCINIKLSPAHMES